MQKEIETPNFSNTPGFAGPVGRVGLLGENNSVCVSIEFDSEEKFILFIFHMTVHYVLMNICFYTDYENCTIDRIFLLHSTQCQSIKYSVKNNLEKWDVN